MNKKTDYSGLEQYNNALENKCAELHNDLEALLKKLGEEKAKSEDIIAAIGDPVIIIDTDYRVLYQNKIADGLFGDNTGQCCYAAYQGRKEVCLECALTQTWQDGRIHKIEKIMTYGNDTKYVEIAASPLKDSTGKLVAGIEIIRDITKRKLVEQELQKTNFLLKAVLESTTDGILAVDPEGRLLTYNQRFVEIWQIPSHILEQYGDDKALEYVLDQVQHPEAFLQKVKDLYRSPDVTDLDVIFFKDGRSIERYTRPLVINGSNKGRVWSFRDITKFSQAEEEKTELVDELQKALAEVKRYPLSGFLPICSHCKNIRDNDGQWIQIEAYISKHSEAVFTHGICPECIKMFHPEQYKTIYPQNR
ncbi:MAG: PAS domain-containing protein [Proteobacteria bacterium]|nr:PAS domain-containing protein [Pseudomonadota bacterium]MBU4297379.1 PAS domain-containing protein [Pseudomonadota bacterium]MCG2747021.1 PAS domain-containing protein [Desulfobulbaceae bacterium]